MDYSIRKDLKLVELRRGMGDSMTDLSNSIKKFEKMLKIYSDDTKNMFDFWTFIKNFIRIKDSSLPTIAVMTVIKYEKPTIFSALRKLSKQYQALDFLTNIDMEYDKAKEQLEQFKSG